ncbi:sterol desaturase family protein [Aliterella atlantica]|uniref:sterol desaturase family protein n=1 Tax=Aliterella atlantica TaxID=1827278 RepID=UPI000697A765|nr:sterol desaturase family protein [Aliterella atlantica]
MNQIEEFTQKTFIELAQGLLYSIQETLLYASNNYFRLTLVSFLVFWLILGPKLTHFRIQPRPRTKTTIILREIGSSLLTFVVIGTINWFLSIAIPGDRYGLFYDNYYNDISKYGWTYFFFSIFLMLVIDDTYFYWAHRLLHHSILYRRVHKVHHYSNDPNPFTTYSFHPLEAAILFFGYRLTPSIIPVHSIAVDLWLLLTLINSVVDHLGYEIYPQWFTNSKLTNWKNPSTHHNMHHEKVRGNYAVTFRWWDKLMGTEFPDYQARVKAVQARKIISNRRLKTKV